MCGILACLRYHGSEAELRAKLLKLQKRLRHRGPDWSGLHLQHTPQGLVGLAHERLAIVDPLSGAQPLFTENGKIAVAANGEIYNHKKIRAEHLQSINFRTASDCEVIGHLYEKFGNKMMERGLLDGMFAFVVSDETTGRFMAARDHIGICPLYYGRSGDGSIWFSSEMKAINDVCITFECFPPGHYYDSETDEVRPWYKPIFWDPAYVPAVATGEPPFAALRETFERAVIKRLMTDVPYGVLLSGGLDSSLVASVASRHVAMRVEDDEKSQAWWPRLHSFSVGLKDSPDLIAARKVAEFIGTQHHEFVFTIQEGIDALSDVIYQIETYDVTSIRASTPMYLMSRKIKAMGVKMVLSGEGADEILGGYLYFHKAPDREEFHHETVRKLKDLHLYDCNRANKATSAWGVEARVPFLDREYMEVAMTMDPTFKMTGGKDKDGRPRIEKWVMRKAFDTPDRPYLPEEVLWRQKEQFSDGVGYGWIDGLKDYANSVITDQMLKTAVHRFPDNTPSTKEGYLYRSIFEQHFPQRAAIQTVPGGPSVACSTAIAAKWDASWAGKEDPSGRAVGGVHADAYAAANGHANGIH